MEYTISLYYVEGISEVDTPFFSSKAEQSEYFSQKLVKTLSSSYYPPYYRNKIKFGSDDLTLDTRVNYLSLDTSERKYYYFITSAMYISDGILELSISMDVIQTYLFDFEIRNCVIERKFINRYNSDGTFNRNYIRENVSNGQYLKGKTNYIVPEQAWYVGRVNKEFVSATAYKYGNNATIPSSTCVAIIPNNFTASYNRLMLNNDSSTVPPSTEVVMQTLGKSAYIETISYVPFDIFKGKYTKGSKTIDGKHFEGYIFNDDYGYINIDNTKILSHKVSSLLGDTGYNEVQYNWQDLYTFTISSTKSTKIGTYFNIDFVPALLDEAYQALLFGENSCYAVAKLRYINNPTIKFKALFDFDTFNRVYGFEINNESIDTPSYDSVISSTSSIDITLLNSTERTWIAQNKASFITSIIDAVGNAFINFGGK